MTVRLTAVRNGTLLTDGEEHKREGRNSQNLARKRENFGSKRSQVGENKVLGVG